MKRAGVLAVAMAVPAALLSAGASVSAAPAHEHSGTGVLHAPCGSVPEQDEDDTGRGHVDAATNMRSGSTIDCSINGVAFPSQVLNYYCFTWNRNGSYSWTYARNTETGVRGWVRDDQLHDNGSTDKCDGLRPALH